MPVTPAGGTFKPAANSSGRHLIRCFVCRRQLLRGLPASMTCCDGIIKSLVYVLCQYWIYTNANFCFNRDRGAVGLIEAARQAKKNRHLPVSWGEIRDVS